MSFALLSVELLACGLLWLALVQACTGRFRWALARGLAILFLAELPLIYIPVMVVIATAFAWKFHQQAAWLMWGQLLAAFLVLGLLILLRLGRPRIKGAVPAAASWHRGWLLAMFLIALALTANTYQQMTIAVHARARMLAMQSDTRWLSTGPAIASEAQNAACFYEKAFARLLSDPGNEVKDPPLGDGDAFDPNEPAMLAFLARHQQTLALLHQAAELTGCRFDEDLVPTDSLEFNPPLSIERQAGYLLVLDARLQIAQGHVPQAIADIDTVFKMSRHFTQRPTLIGGLVGLGVDGMAAYHLQDVLPAVQRRQDLDGLHLQSLSPIRPVFWRVFEGEERWGLTLFSGGDPGGLQGYAGTLQLTYGRLGAVMLPDELDSYGPLLDEFKQATRQPYYKVRLHLLELEQSYGWNHPHRGFFTSMLVPSAVTTLRTLAKAEATDACAVVGVAMTRYRLDHGKLPAQLGELVPDYLDAVPTDPIDGQPLRMIVNGDERIIYSIGSRKDDKTEATPDSKQGYVVFVVRSSVPATQP